MGDPTPNPPPSRHPQRHDKRHPPPPPGHPRGRRRYPGAARVAWHHAARAADLQQLADALANGTPRRRPRPSGARLLRALSDGAAAPRGRRRRPDAADPIRRSSSRSGPGTDPRAHPVNPLRVDRVCHAPSRRGPGDYGPPRSGSPARRSLVGERRTIDSTDECQVGGCVAWDRATSTSVPEWAAAGVRRRSTRSYGA